MSYETSLRTKEEFDNEIKKKHEEEAVKSRGRKKACPRKVVQTVPSEGYTYDDLSGLTKEQVELIELSHDDDEKGRKECSDCGAIFSTSKAFLYHCHRAAHCAKLPFICRECDLAFGNRNVLYEHARIQHSEGVKKLPCPLPACEIFSGSVEQVNRHLNEDHRTQIIVKEEDYNILANLQSASFKYTCENCSESFRTQLSFNFHKYKNCKTIDESNQPHKSFQCKRCGSKFNYKSLLVLHLRNKHNILATESTLDALNVPSKAQQCIDQLVNVVLSSSNQKGPELHSAFPRNNITQMDFPVAKKSKKDENFMNSIDNNDDARKYVCAKCDGKFNTIEEFKVHAQAHTLSLMYECPLNSCDKYLSRVNNVNSHLVTIHNEFSLQVTGMDYRSGKYHMINPFKGDLMLKKNRNENNSEPIKPKKKPEDPQEGEKVGQSYLIKQSRMRIGKDRINQKYECKVCTFKSSSERMVLLHFRQRHKKNKRVFRCNFCSSQFNLKLTLERHIATIHYDGSDINANNVKASEGRRDDNLAYKEALKNNTALWSLLFQNPVLTLSQPTLDPLVFQDLVSQQLMSMSLLNVPGTPPIKTNEISEKNHSSSSSSCSSDCAEFKCEDCGANFKHKPHLQYHQRKQGHGGLEGFKCEDCGMIFGVKAHLINHRRKHTGEKPYSCPICQVTFSRVDIVNIHLRNVHNSDIKLSTKDTSPPSGTVAPISKNITPDSAVQPETPKKNPITLTQTNGHPIENRYKCFECGKVFERSYQLSRHR
ncbi:DgyrCDS12744 [Dimorphilus gyrociliatus]|nr:DgyrCDS12744 [Dimorphilus gyrociliatus]